MDTLVLSHSYYPIGRISWKRAVTLLFQEKIEIIEEYSNKEIKSPSFTMKLPSIVRFVSKIRMFRKQVKFSRENVYIRDKGKCQYCLDYVTRREFTYDHVTPRSQGGETSWKNIVVSCMKCNQRKGGRTPNQAGMTLHTKPSKPDKLPNFCPNIVAWEESIPDSWKEFLTSYTYWNGKLKN